MWWAMGCIIVAPVNMPVQASQHCTPRVVSWKFRLPAHQQRAIVDCPCELLEMVSVIHVQQRTRHQACWSSPPCAVDWCTAAQRGIGSHRQLQSFHLPSAAFLFGQRCKKVHLTQTVTSLAYSHCASHLRDARNRSVCSAS